MSKVGFNHLTLFCHSICVRNIIVVPYATEKNVICLCLHSYLTDSCNPCEK